MQGGLMTTGSLGCCRCTPTPVPGTQGLEDGPQGAGLLGAAAPQTGRALARLNRHFLKSWRAGCRATGPGAALVLSASPVSGGPGSPSPCLGVPPLPRETPVKSDLAAGDL